MKQFKMNIIPKLFHQKLSQQVLPNHLTTTNYFNTKGRNIIMTSIMSMKIQNNTRISSLSIRCNSNNHHPMDISSSSYERREYFDGTKRKNPKRVWRAELSFQNSHHNNNDDNESDDDDSQKTTSSIFKNVWYKSIDDNDLSSMRDVVNRISEQEKQGGRMRQRKLGVLRYVVF